MLFLNEHSEKVSLNLLIRFYVYFMVCLIKLCFKSCTVPQLDVYNFV